LGKCNPLAGAKEATTSHLSGKTTPITLTMEPGDDKERQKGLADQDKASQVGRNIAIAIAIALFGLTGCSLAIYAGISSRKKSDKKPPPLMIGLPKLAEAWSKAGGTLIANIKPIIKRPLFIGVSIAAIVIVAALSITLYFTIPMMQTNPSELSAEVVPEKVEDKPKPEEGPETQPSPSDQRNQFRASSVVSGIVIVVIFAIAVFLLVKFSPKMNIKILIPLIVALVAVFFVIVYFEGTIFPFLANAFRQLFLKMAHSTIDNMEEDSKA
jgi:hypothetical protein